MHGREFSTRVRRLAALATVAMVLPACIVPISVERRAADDDAQEADFSDVQPEFSPDGTTIVFSSDRSGNEEVWTVAADGTRMQQLTDHPAADLDPTFSPDGSKILFDANRDSASPHLYLMNADGADPIRLTEDGLPGGIFPAWSPDGTQIAFACGPAFTNLGICLMNADGTGRMTLIDSPNAREWEPTWSPDGAAIALVSDEDGDDEIYVIQVATQAVSQLTDNDVRDADPAWSPDGSRIAFDSGEGILQIYVMDAAGGGVAALTDGRRGGAAPSWSRDGERIAFHGFVNGQVRIFTMAADGSDVEQVTE